MGIFGRDEHPTSSKTSAQGSAGGRSHGPSAAQPGGSTVIARGNRIEGTISGSSDIQVDGELQGSIEGSGVVRVAPQGRVEGTVAGRVVVVAGTVRGDISAAETAELESSAKVTGNITAPRIRIADGASFDGQVLMKEAATKAHPPASTARREPT
ncbi:MAG TPA: polymer-forming cytoskeletal protein [Thermoanaerobaculales bacterium]|nr:polymer-forming cytoskeletal protein [Thermoanaerobaculales bacterium]HPA83031.1 polymer-forming cytoskeletal protein [Thermoanaerobaculales bacterium]HQL31153.1 polymer-forming cytoskeletal protein [Thermoanaerobaculales bacterium]HQN94880.1 polymer-forming cytoskeletal protein [Thermoanaerobaculales bacterium]